MCVILKTIVYDNITPKEETYKVPVKCNFPGCREGAINSHLLQRARFLKEIAEDGVVLQMADEHLQPSYIDGYGENMYILLPIKKALSIPLFCKLHDEKEFKKIEVGNIDPTNLHNLLLLSYRTLCAMRAEEQRRFIFYQFNSVYNPICQGPTFNEQQNYSKFAIQLFEKNIEHLYSAYKRKDDDLYQFDIYHIQKVPICVSECVVDENAIYKSYNSPPSIIPMLIVHCMPFETETVVAIGYSKELMSAYVAFLLDRIKSVSNNIQKFIKLILALTNNWSVSPSLFGEDPNSVCEELFNEKMKIWRMMCEQKYINYDNFNTSV